MIKNRKVRTGELQQVRRRGRSRALPCDFQLIFPRSGLTLAFCSIILVKHTKTTTLPDGVMVAQLILVQFVLVRVQVGQPFWNLHGLEPRGFFFSGT